MKKSIFTLLFAVVTMLFAGCASTGSGTKVVMETTAGTMEFVLYDETPKHRDNFIKLAQEQYFDSLLFHRVIKDFMIQGGDPDSKYAEAGVRLGEGGPSYRIDAEFIPTIMHKRGALAAAREGDGVNPMKKSSASQFYIVWGKVYKAAELKQLEHQLKMQQEQNIFNALAVEHRDEIMAMRRNRDREGLMALQEKLGNMAIAKSKEQGAPTFTPEQVEAYTTLGGTPFLDGGYTVFGEVTEGLDIGEKIQTTQTSPNDRPKSDIAMEVTVIEA